MENLNTKTNYTYEKDETGFNMKEAKKVTEDKLNSVGKTYQEVIKDVYQDGRLYLVELSEGYTLYGQTKRYARRNAEIGFIARAAKEEKDLALGMADYAKGFKENKIHFNGKDIPTFIDLEEDWKAEQDKKKAKETKKTEEVKQDK